MDCVFPADVYQHLAEEIAAGKSNQNKVTGNLLKSLDSPRFCECVRCARCVSEAFKRCGVVHYLGNRFDNKVELRFMLRAVQRMLALYAAYGHMENICCFLRMPAIHARYWNSCCIETEMPIKFHNFAKQWKGSCICSAGLACSAWRLFRVR